MGGPAVERQQAEGRRARVNDFAFRKCCVVFLLLPPEPTPTMSEAAGAGSSSSGSGGGGGSSGGGANAEYEDINDSAAGYEGGEHEGGGYGGDDAAEDYGDDLEAELAAVAAMVEEAESANVKIQETADSAKADAADVLAEKARKEEEQKERDTRSVFVKNVHWDATGPELAEFFASCGSVRNALILMDKHKNQKPCVGKGWRVFLFSSIPLLPCLRRRNLLTHPLLLPSLPYHPQLCLC